MNDSKALIIQHRQLSAKIKSLQTDLEAIERNPRYQKELEFAEKLDLLMNEHGKSAKDIVSILNPEIAMSGATSSERGPKTGTPRKRITYKNPHSGEEIKTASGNNRVLKEWKVQYPNEDIKTWIVE